MGIVNGLSIASNKALNNDVIGIPQMDYNNLALYNLHLNKAWYSGDPIIIDNFYKRNKGVEGLDMGAVKNYFWNTAPNSTIKLHYPIASSISQTMSTLLFNEGLSIKTNLTKDPKDIEQSQIRLDKILTFNKSMEKFQKGAEYESWSGHIAFKMLIDDDFGTTPIYEVYSLDRFEIIEKFGITIAILFIDYYTHFKKEFKLITKYGRGHITFTLHKKNNKGEWIRCSLKECKDTADLADVYFTDTKGDLIDVIFAVHKPNRLPNNSVIENPYGRSDYAGLSGKFNMYDENASSWNIAIRQGKVKTYIPEELLPVDTKTGNTLKPNYYDTEIVILSGKKSDNLQIKTEQADLKIDQYTKTTMELNQSILSKVGLSPVTLGILAGLGANLARKSLREAQQTSIKTRAEKIELWQPRLIELAHKLLTLEDIAINVIPIEEEIEGVLVKTFIVKDDIIDYNITASFGEYLSPTIDERIKQMDIAKKAGVADVAKRVEEVWKDTMTPDAKTLMITNIISEGVVDSTSPTLKLDVADVEEIIDNQ